MRERFNLRYGEENAHDTANYEIDDGYSEEPEMQGKFGHGPLPSVYFILY